MSSHPRAMDAVNLQRDFLVYFDDVIFSRASTSIFEKLEAVSPTLSNYVLPDHPTVTLCFRVKRFTNITK